MKKTFLFCFISFIFSLTNIFAAPISTYLELASAIRSGNHFVILLDVQQCTHNSSMPLGYFIPKAMMIIPTSETACERITTSDLHFTDHFGIPTYEYVKYSIHSDNTVIIRTKYYDPQSFNIIGEGYTLNCRIGKGIEIHTNDPG